jgi:hypothetical protein
MFLDHENTDKTNVQPHFSWVKKTLAMTECWKADINYYVVYAAHNTDNDVNTISCSLNGL